MRRLLCSSLSLALLIVLALPARGEEPGEWLPESAAHLGGAHGLTGFGSMVDGRVPSPFLAPAQAAGPLGTYSTRLSLRYAFELRNRTIHGEQGDYESRRQRHGAVASYGFTVQGLDVGLSVPFVQDYERLRVPGQARATDRAFGLGDVVVGLKVAFRIPKFWFGDWAVAAFGPYALGRLPSGSPGLADPAEVEAGVAVAGPYGFSFRWHGNLAIRQRSGGVSALVYRFGASAVPLARDGQVLRVYAHLSGVEFEGRANSDLDLELGGQLLFGGLWTLDVGVALRLVDAGFVERDVRGRVRTDLGDGVRGADDEGTLSVTFGIGVVL